MTSNVNSGECVQRLECLLEGVPSRYGFRINEMWDLKVPVPWERTPEEDWLADDLRLHLVREGCGAYYVEGQWIPMSRGLLMLFHPPLHFGHRAAVDDPPSIVSCHFDLIDADKGKYFRERTEPFFWCCRLTTGEYERILPFFENISSLYRDQNDRKYREELCSSALHQLLGLVRNLCLSNQSGAFDPRVEEARLHIDRNPTDNRPVSALAADFGLGKDYFTRLFHRQVGMSLKSYRLKSRMHYARYLLTLRSEVKSVASELGYSDQFVFSRLFKQIHGITPSSLKRSTAEQFPFS